MQEIEVKEGGSVLASGATCDLGNVTVGERATRTITVTNKGESALLVSGIDLDREGEISRVNVPALPRSLAPGE